MHDVFISYARKDAESAELLEAFLAQMGLRCFLDDKSIPPGEDWAAAIAKAISECGAVVCLISNHESRFLENELHFAKDKRLIPVFLSRDVQLPENLRLLIGSRQYVYIDPSLQATLPKIFQAILPWVDRTKHSTAYTAYTEHTATIDEADVRLRSNFCKRVEPSKENLGRPDEALGEGTIETDTYVFRSYDESFVGHAFEAIPVVTDFVFEARMRRRNGPIEEWFGIEFGFRGNPGHDCYQFLINGHRTLRVAKHFKGEFKDPIPPHKARGFRPGGVSDELKIVRNGRNIHLFGNQQLAATLVDFDIRTGRIGPTLGKGLTVEFSGILINAIRA